MAAGARWELTSALNAELNGVIPDPPNKELDFSIQYILEVDLEYPCDIHDRKGDYLLASKLMEI